MNSNAILATNAPGPSILRMALVYLICMMLSKLSAPDWPYVSIKLEILRSQNLTFLSVLRGASRACMAKANISEHIQTVSPVFHTVFPLAA